MYIFRLVPPYVWRYFQVSFCLSSNSTRYKRIAYLVFGFDFWLFAVNNLSSKYSVLPGFKELELQLQNYCRFILSVFLSSGYIDFQLSFRLSFRLEFGLVLRLDFNAISCRPKSYLGGSEFSRSSLEKVLPFGNIVFLLNLCIPQDFPTYSTLCRALRFAPDRFTPRLRCLLSSPWMWGYGRCLFVCGSIWHRP